jgi:hypothetical protein
VRRIFLVRLLDTSRLFTSHSPIGPQSCAPVGGLGLSGSFENEISDLAGLRYQRQVAGFHLDRFGAHPLRHEAFEIRIDRPVVDGHGVQLGLDRHAACVVLSASRLFLNGP